LRTPKLKRLKRSPWKRIPKGTTSLGHPECLRTGQLTGKITGKRRNSKVELGEEVTTASKRIWQTPKR